MHPLTDADPDRIGRYRLTGRLGAGGMGTVYLASTPGGRPVAVKVIGGQLAHDERALERFCREVDTLHTVRSAYTASVIDCGLDTAPYWFATEYVPGRTLHAAVSASGALPAPLCRSLLAALAEGLSDIHAHAVLHRDVKPQNIILSPVGPQLIDFGIARGSGQSALTQAGLTAGTPGFTAPEAFDGEEVGFAADVFALGATVAFAATGRPPFGEGAFPAVAYRTVHGDIDVEGVEPGLAALITACTDRDPARRPVPGRIVELCQSPASLAGDPVYQRLAAPATTPGTAAGAPALVPTQRDASGAAPAARPHEVETVPAVLPAAPTRALPAGGPAAPDPWGGPPGPRQPAGTAPGVPASPGADRRGPRRTTVAAVAAGAGVLAAALLVLQPWQGGEEPAGARSGAEASATATGDATGKDTATDEGTGTGEATGGGGAADGDAGAEPDAPAAPRESTGPGAAAGGGAGEGVPAERVISAPTTLGPGEEVAAARIRLVLQHDGNLVAYDESGQARWATRTLGTGARADFQSDGNLVVYDTHHQAVWASRTNGHASAALKLQSDGNIVILEGETVLWAAGTQH
ncbi:protein kinase [Streptomyces sp. NPDC017202]|uniref:protein kinase domain-containing protein n=1 Tax=Streptomyces sp. NPDC017202 TaxID=3364981 RepID=UPI00378D9884